MASSAPYQPPTSFAVFPPVVKNLLILNGLAFVAQLIFQARSGAGIGVVEEWFALWPAGIPSGEALPAYGGRFWPWQLLTSGFLHGSFSHILFNMFGLWMFGGVIERDLGSQRFLFYFLACVVGASALQVLVVSAPLLFGVGEFAYVPTLGASGGVLGVLAAFGLLHPEQKVFLLFIPVPIPARIFVLGYAAIDLFSGLSGYSTGVAHFAHLGGMLTGVVLLLYWLGRLPVKPRARLA